MEFDIGTVRFDQNGLVPAIVQDYYSKKVLTLAYMNRQSLEISLKERRTCFYSRSRQTLWRKGETSGNTQQIVSVTADCDCDALLVEVIKAGPACHLGADSCFGGEIYRDKNHRQFSVTDLYELIRDRRDNPAEGSYTTYLFQKGDDKILKKVGEECTEVVIAAKNNDGRELTYEIADLAYHTLVLMVHKGLSVAEILEELGSRHVVDKKVKQEKMQ